MVPVPIWISEGHSSYTIDLHLDIEPLTITLRMQPTNQILIDLTVQPSNPSLSTLDPTNRYFSLTSSDASASHTSNFKALQWTDTYLRHEYFQ